VPLKVKEPSVSEPELPTPLTNSPFDTMPPVLFPTVTSRSRWKAVPEMMPWVRVIAAVSGVELLPSNTTEQWGH